MTTVGILGAGQLARMLALAGLPLGLKFKFLDPAPDACAAVLGRHLCDDYESAEALAAFARDVDVITYEFENVPAASVAFLAERVPTFPRPDALAIARDRLREKSLFRQLGIPTVDFVPVDSLEALRQASAAIGFPSVLKTRTLGYDGKGQMVLRSPDDIDEAWARLGATRLLIIENFVKFDREVSIIAARGRDERNVFYPLSENVHKNGILRLARCRTGDVMQGLAQDYCGRILEHLDYVGILTLEFFQVGDALLANEIAPRVHNSGHWSIEGAETSQFENHLRAILGWPLGSPRVCRPVSMVNLIGRLPDLSKVLEMPGAHLHVYDKAARAGRKIGHITWLGDDASISDIYIYAKITAETDQTSISI